MTITERRDHYRKMQKKRTRLVPQHAVEFALPHLLNGLPLTRVAAMYSAMTGLSVSRQALAYHIKKHKEGKK